MKQLCQVFSTPGSKLVEYCFHMCRLIEQRHQSSNTATCTRKWVEPVNRKIISQVHHFRAVSWNDYQIRGDEPQSLPRHTYACPTGKHKTSLNFASIVSTVHKSQWPTFTADSWPFQLSELSRLVHWSENNLWTAVDCAWLCGLFGSGLLVQEGSDTAWYLTLGTALGFALRWSFAPASSTQRRSGRHGRLLRRTSPLSSRRS